MILSHSRKFIFLHIHKTGGESVVAALEPYLDENDLVPTRNSGPDGLRKHSPARTVREIVPAETWNNYFKFAFVRHPIDRTISHYNYCARMAEQRWRPFPHKGWYRARRGAGKNMLRWPSMQAFLATNSFSEFIRHPALVNEPGMQPQFNFISDDQGTVIIDLVARYERFDADFAKVQATLGLPPIEAPRKNSSPQRLVARADLPDDDIAFLAEHFEVDFARLDYQV